MTTEQLIAVRKAVKKIMLGATEPMHTFEHAKRVAKNAEKIAEILGVKTGIDMNILLSACLLHDVPKSLSKPTFLATLMNHWFESVVVKKTMPAILNKLGIIGRDRELILDATINHTLSYPYRRLHKNGSIYTKILQDADTFELFSPSRVEIFNKVKEEVFIYRNLDWLKEIHLYLGKKHLDWFLNYPELAAHREEIYRYSK